LNSAKFEDLTTVLMNMQGFRNVTPCRLVNSYGGRGKNAIIHEEVVAQE